MLIISLCHVQTVLRDGLEEMKQFFTVNSSCRLPLNPALLVTGINIQVLNTHTYCIYDTHLSLSASFLTTFLFFQSCSFFNSNAVPLKLSFQNLDPLGDHISVIFKVRRPTCLSLLQTAD